MDSNRKRNAVAVGGVYILVLALWLLAPPEFHNEVEILCGGVATGAKFANMKACVMAPEFRECSCSRIRNKWSIPYALGVTPLLTTLLGYALLRGSLVVRLLLLNAAVTAAVITEFIFELMKNAAVALYALYTAPIALPALWLVMSLIFLLIKFFHERVFRKNAGAKAV